MLVTFSARSAVSRSVCLCALSGALWCLRAAAATFLIVPDADSFLRSFAPTNNYGAGGAVSVSGSAAVNGSGDQNGLFDTVMRFSLSNAVASFNSAFYGSDWVLTSARLIATETAAPDNAIFNRGVGAFEIRWIANDNWLEGTGTPKTPTTNGVAWQDLPLLLNPSLDRSLGVFTNTGTDGQVAFSLALPDSFVTDLRSGSEVGLYLTASSSEVGFTFNSRNFGNTNAQPGLELTAIPNPRPLINLGGDPATISVSFTAATNLVYRLQRADSVANLANWADVLTVPPQTEPTNIVYTDGLTNTRAFYRLSVLP